MIKAILNYLKKPISLVVLNACLVIAAILGNMYFQVFCRPSTWSMVLIVICFGHCIFAPWTSRLNMFPILFGVLEGLSFFFLIYCMLFLEGMAFLGLFAIFFFGIGFLLLLPLILLFQMGFRNWHTHFRFINNKGFIATAILVAIAGSYIGYAYQRELENFKKFQDSNFAYLNDSFLTEKILGMHFLYHTRICLYDGWRPPVHEPVLVIGRWLNGGEDPLPVDLDKRVTLYQKMYPNKPVKLDCSCAKIGAVEYQKDRLWE